MDQEKKASLNARVKRARVQERKPHTGRPGRDQSNHTTGYAQMGNWRQQQAKPCGLCCLTGRRPQHMVQDTTRQAAQGLQTRVPHQRARHDNGTHPSAVYSSHLCTAVTIGTTTPVGQPPWFVTSPPGGSSKEPHRQSARVPQPATSTTAQHGTWEDLPQSHEQLPSPARHSTTYSSHTVPSGSSGFLTPRHHITDAQTPQNPPENQRPKVYSLLVAAAAAPTSTSQLITTAWCQTPHSTQHTDRAERVWCQGEQHRQQRPGDRPCRQQLHRLHGCGRGRVQPWRAVSVRHTQVPLTGPGQVHPRPSPSTVLAPTKNTWCWHDQVADQRGAHTLLRFCDTDHWHAGTYSSQSARQHKPSQTLACQRTQKPQMKLQRPGPCSPCCCRHTALSNIQRTQTCALSHTACRASRPTKEAASGHRLAVPAAETVDLVASMGHATHIKRLGKIGCFTRTTRSVGCYSPTASDTRTPIDPAPQATRQTPHLPKAPDRAPSRKHPGLGRCRTHEQRLQAIGDAKHAQQATQALRMRPFDWRSRAPSPSSTPPHAMASHTLTISLSFGIAHTMEQRHTVRYSPNRGV